MNDKIINRSRAKFVSLLVATSLVTLSFYEVVTALLGETPAIHWHYAIFLSIILPAVILTYSINGDRRDLNTPTDSLSSFKRIPIYDWFLAVLSFISSFFVAVTYTGVDWHLFGIHINLDLLAFRVGNPTWIDVFLGSILIICTVEATRRSIGNIFLIIIAIFSAYGIFGKYIPNNILKHPGVNWSEFINHIILSTEGIYGPTLKVVSTVVFLFVLFGEFSQKMGLGDFFLRAATSLAGRYTGGPAKVSVISSAFFGMISGSSVSNTVTTGSLTIPAMKRIGFPGYFAGAVEAASSTGGQITPPLMGAAAFVMVEFLDIPYRTIIAAAALPASMHYLGLLGVVHFQAKRLGIRGLEKDQIPKFMNVIREDWPTVLPLAILLTLLFKGFTPQFAGAWGIVAAIAVGLINPRKRMPIKDIINALYSGAKQALPVAAVCTAVGIVIGVITLSGLAFRLGFIVTNLALDFANIVNEAISWVPLISPEITTLSIFFTLVLIGIANILMGAGIPTTALYIMLAPITSPALANLGVPPLAAHLFVLYYGVLADITPPVCVSAYAAAGIADANPLKTGFQAFSMGMAKIIVPFIFVYSPSFLIVIKDYFEWSSFIQTLTFCVLGIFILSMAVGGYALRPLNIVERILLGFAGLLVAAPNLGSTIFGMMIVAPLLFYSGIRKFFKQRIKGSSKTLKDSNQT